MYSRDDDNNFFRPLKKRELDRVHELWIRAQWLKEKADKRDKESEYGASNLYRKELSATLWAHDYILAHNEKLLEERK